MNIKQRLAMYKFRVGQHGVSDWREVATKKHYWSESPARVPVVLGVAIPNTRRRFVSNEDIGKIGLRNVGSAHEILPRTVRHTGWFCDNFGDTTYTGQVWQLPARNGEALYLSGYSDSEAGGAIVDFTICYEKTTAALWADSLAQREAEESRDYYAKEEKQREVEELKERVEGLHVELKNWLENRKNTRSSLLAHCDLDASRAVAALVARQIKNLIEEIREARKVIARLIRDNGLEV